jgi:hypothetical protein
MQYALVFLFFTGVFKAYSDALTDNGIKAKQWMNKYKDMDTTFKHWWYLGFYKPTFREKFAFSTTLFVFLTDAWHLCQFFMIRCFCLSICCALEYNMVDLLLYGFVFYPLVVSLGFNVWYKTLRKNLR